MQGSNKQSSVGRALGVVALFAALHGAPASAQTALVLTPPVVLPDTEVLFTPQFFGMHIHNANNAADWPSFGTVSTARNVSTGASTITQQGKIGAFRFWDGAGTWAEVQPYSAATFNFTRADLYVQRASANGARSLLTLGRTPAWASARPTEASAYGAGMAAEAKDINAWRTYVKALATRYKGQIEAYQVWNEANTTPMWTGTTAKLVELTCAAYDEIKKADPAALVVAPSGAGAYDARSIWVKQFLAAGGSKCVDIVSYHLYTGNSGPEAFVLPMQSMQKTLYTSSYRFRYWSTEAGYLAPNSVNSTTGWSAYELANKIDDATAASYVVRAMLLARSLGFERFYWYAWDNLRLGFTDPVTFKPRLHAVYLQQFVAWFQNAKLQGCSRSTLGVWVCNVTFAGSSQFAGKRGSVVWIDPTAKLQSQSVAVIRSAVLKFNPAENPALTATTIDALPAVTKVTVTSVPQLVLWK